MLLASGGNVFQRIAPTNWIDFCLRWTTEEGNLQQPGHLAAAGAMRDIICEEVNSVENKALKTPENKK